MALFLHPLWHISCSSWTPMGREDTMLPKHLIISIFLITLPFVYFARRVSIVNRKQLVGGLPQSITNFVPLVFLQACFFFFSKIERQKRCKFSSIYTIFNSFCLFSDYLFEYLFFYISSSILIKISLVFALHFSLCWDPSLGKKTKDHPRRPSQQDNFKRTATKMG